MPTYNCARHVGAAVESVLGQTFDNYELVVVDDGSTDETRLVLQPYQNRLIYIWQENQERSAARNRGIQEASGDYVAFLDADDLWLPSKLERQVAVLDQHPEAVLVYCQSSYMDEYGHDIQLAGRWIDGEASHHVVVVDRQKDVLMQRILQTGSTAVVRRRALALVGNFDTTLNYGEDWDLWLRLAREGPFAYIPEVLSRYRVRHRTDILVQQASPGKIAQLVRVLDNYARPVDPDRVLPQSAKAEAETAIYIDAAFASLRLGQPRDAQAYLNKALTVSPQLSCGFRLAQLVADGARTVQLETGSYEKALEFIDLFFQHLPRSALSEQSTQKTAIALLYLNAAFERHARNDLRSARRFWSKAFRYEPHALLNRGAISIGLDVWLGRYAANAIRYVAQASIKGHKRVDVAGLRNVRTKAKQ